MFRFRILLITITLLGLFACKMPEQRQSYYPNGYLKERYWVYQQSGQEVMDGLYTSWFSNGEKELEILYEEGRVITRTFYSDQGTTLGTVNVAAGEP